MNFLLNTPAVPGAFEYFLNSISAAFSNFGIADAIDIIVLAAIGFLAFRFFEQAQGRSRHYRNCGLPCTVDDLVFCRA